jgi:hypothetical protein
MLNVHAGFPCSFYAFVLSLQLHPIEIARQLTLIQSEYFRAIHPSELVDASWMKDEKKEDASPHLLKLNRFETTVSGSLVAVVFFFFLLPLLLLPYSPLYFFLPSSSFFFLFPV